MNTDELLTYYGITPEDVAICRRNMELNLLLADCARHRGALEIGKQEAARLRRDIRRLEQGRPRMPEPSLYARAVWARGFRYALNCVLPQHRRHGLVELAVYGWWADTGVPIRLGDLAVFVEEVFRVSEADAEDLISAAISEPSDDVAGVCIRSKDVVERVLDLEIPAPEPLWVGELILTDHRVWVSAEAQAIGLLAERWDEWTALRACEFDTAGSA